MLGEAEATSQWTVQQPPEGSAFPCPNPLCTRVAGHHNAPTSAPRQNQKLTEKCLLIGFKTPLEIFGLQAILTPCLDKKSPNKFLWGSLPWIPATANMPGMARGLLPWSGLVSCSNPFVWSRSARYLASRADV